MSTHYYRSNILRLLLLITTFTLISSKQTPKVRASSIEKWDQFEASLNGPSNGNPFVDYQLNATFTFQGTGDNKPFYVNGFYDGNGIYKIRFMPNQIGTWKYITSSNVASMNNINSTFTATSPTNGNLGPVFVNPSTNKSFIFAENETEHFSVGTTAYAWWTRPKQSQLNTINTMKQAFSNNIFNKLRMLVFPKRYEYTYDEPILYPYVGTPPNQWGDFHTFNVSYWQHLDDMLEQLKSIGNGQFIADVILFHPYDNGHWGFDCMGGRNASTYNITNDIFYLKYIIARIASYRHVWWSMANEFDDVACKNQGIPKNFNIWDQYFEALIEYDPYRNPQKEKGIHNGRHLYNYSQPWTTHFSVQGYTATPFTWFQTNFSLKYTKPVILDEVQYEGNSSGLAFEDLTAGVETMRFWMGNAGGKYVGHSEIVLANLTDDPSKTTQFWWNYGGVLRGSSPGMIGYFHDFMINTTMHPPFSALTEQCLLYVDATTKDNCLVSYLYKKNEYYLFHWTYNGQMVYYPTVNVKIDDDVNAIYQVSYIDWFAQTVTEVNEVIGTEFVFTAPTIPYNLQLIKKGTRMKQGL